MPASIGLHWDENIRLLDRIFIFLEEVPLGVVMKLYNKFTITSLISLTLYLGACANNETGVHNAEPAEEKTVENKVSIADSTLYRHVTILRIKDYYGNISEWHESDCKIADSTFSCYTSECMGNCPTLGLLLCTDSNGDDIACPEYKDTINDTTYKNLNFGDEALLHYIPVANIPAFDKEAVKKALSNLSGNYCSQIFQIRSNYSIDAIGLPKSFSWKNRNDYDWGLEAYVKSDEKTNESKCEVREPLVLYNPDANAYWYISWSLPEKIQNYTYELFNESMDSYRDTTITWKLVYKDQYGRGDTLDITTKFKFDESKADTTKLYFGRREYGCYDALDSERCK